MAQITRIVIPLILFAAGCGRAEAHSFGVMYTLPIPFWMYAFAVSATLALSFLMIGFFATGQSPERVARPIEIQGVVPRAVWTILRGLSVVLLVLTVLTGLFGAQNPFNNFSLTFFWIGFVLGFAYLTALVGDLYAFINPWRVLCDMIERLRPMAFKARVPYPAWLAYYPALALYMGFIWVELFGQTTPRKVGLILAAYTMLNFAAAALFGAEAWFRYGEFFAVFFRLLRQNLATRLCAEPAAWLEDYRALAPSVHWADRGTRRSSEYFALRFVYAFVDGIRWRARNAALGAGVLEVRLSPFSLGHRPAK